VAIKPPDLLNRLPSVSELLEKPPVRALADRWNRSTVAASVRSFLDELQRDLRRRAEGAQLPSIRELAERAARYIVSQQQQSLGTAINATGRIWGLQWTRRPLADVALERAVAIGREFSPDMPSELEPIICRLTGAEAAAAVHSYSGALWLALSALAAEREVLVARAEIGEVNAADPLPKLAAAAKAHLKEVGTTNRALATDYEAGFSPRAAAILKIRPDAYQVVGETGAAELDELVALSRDRELLLIDAVGSAPIVDPPKSFHWPQRSVQASRAAGADLIVASGDGLIGGPTCGLVIGSRDVVQRVTQHPLYAAVRLDPLLAAAMCATLECYDGAERSANALPVWQLLTAPIENLRNRAERIAPQLAQSTTIASAIPVETRSPISAALASDNHWASYGIALAAVDGNIRALDERLRSLPLPIHGRVEGDRLILDLRTVFPRQDTELIVAVAGPPTTVTATKT
jgi:L-seryl-tRNA(Ser) seleniumtransferase